jgi:hypothetical protein
VSSEGCSTKGVPNSRCDIYQLNYEGLQRASLPWEYARPFRHVFDSNLQACCPCQSLTSWVGAPPDIMDELLLPIHQKATHGVFPKHKFTCIFQSKVTSPSKAFAKVPSLSELTTRFILELRSSFDLLKFDFLIERNVKGRAMEGTAFLLR